VFLASEQSGWITGSDFCVDDVKGARFEGQLIQDGYIVNFPVGNNDN
jgi:hypothetical protein